MLKDKLFYISVGLALAGMYGTAISGEGKQSSPQLSDHGIKITPRKFALISPDFHQRSPWIEVGEGSVSGCPSSPLAFDCFEPDGAIPGLPTDGMYGENCAKGESRWWFGESYCNMFATNDMIVTSGYEGTQSERAEWAWMWYVNGVNTSEQCYVALFTAEDFDNTCDGPSSSNQYTGFIFDYGVLTSGSQGNGQADYYYTDTQDMLCGTGTYWQMPNDGSGAYTMILANDYNGETLTLATCGQPMLWGTKAGNSSSQGPVQWDDDNPTNGLHEAPDECYDYVFGYCPDPLGIMACFYAESNQTPCLDLVIEGNQAGSDMLCTVSNITPYGEAAVIYSGKIGSFQFEGYGWCLDLGLYFKNLGDLRNKIVGGVSKQDNNGDGQVKIVVKIPCKTGGKTIFFQAVQKNTCPDTCSSNVVAVTFEKC